jgi:bacterioferritin
MPRRSWHQEIRARARQQIADGPVTKNYKLDPTQAIGILNEALATELVCMLRYKFYYFMATGSHSAAVAEEFLEHAREEHKHADSLAEHMKQLGGKPQMHPAVIVQASHAAYRAGTSLVDMLREDLVAERVAIETYREMVHYFGDKDPTSRVLMETILAKEEEHADELTNLLFAAGPGAGHKPQALYFGDEVTDNSQASDGIRSS